MNKKAIKYVDALYRLISKADKVYGDSDLTEALAEKQIGTDDLGVEEPKPLTDTLEPEVEPELADTLEPKENENIIDNYESPEGYRVSTVKSPFSHEDEFETMVFPPNSYRAIDSKRYDTEEEAIQGHQKFVEDLPDIIDKYESDSHTGEFGHDFEMGIPTDVGEDELPVDKDELLEELDSFESEHKTEKEPESYAGFNAEMKKLARMISQLEKIHNIS